MTSPGGFLGGVNESNIITHPSHSRNTSLTQLLADLGVAEREGIGVDRMVREMVRVGYQPPTIREIEGPLVRATLVGETLDEPWIRWLTAIEPAEDSADVSSLLLLQHLLNTGWIDEKQAVPLIQLPVEEARGALLKLERATNAGQPLLTQIAGTPDGSRPVRRIGSGALRNLSRLDRAAGLTRQTPTKKAIATSYARERGRISSTELGSLVGASGTNVGSILKALATEGQLEPSSTAGGGRGFHYRWIRT